MCGRQRHSRGESQLLGVAKDYRHKTRMLSDVLLRGLGRPRKVAGRWLGSLDKFGVGTANVG